MSKTNTQIIPLDYVPVRHLVLCGNEVTNHKYLVSDGGFYPILIGEGEIPRVWLFAKTSKQDVIALVEDSVSNSNQIKIDIQNSEKTLEIKDIQSGTPILKLEYKDVVTISYLNLNPVGYDLSGDSSGLRLGKVASLHGNKFVNVPVIVGMGDDVNKKR